MGPLLMAIMEFHGDSLGYITGPPDVFMVVEWVYIRMIFHG